jgi:lipoate-protein ligase A
MPAEWRCNPTMYAVVLSYEAMPFLQQLDQAHQYVMQHLVTALESLAIPVEWKGTCDLTLHDRKFSGNSLRCKKSHLLYHGTLLYDYDLSKIQRYLSTPPRQPEYRLQRQHDDFVTNLSSTRRQLETALIDAWGADEILQVLPQQRSAELQQEKYERDDWNQRL